MRVLVACEESQRVCIAFRERGHKAFSCDIQSSSGGHPEYHIKGDCVPLLNGNCDFITEDGNQHKIAGNWDLIIAHPPCTYFSCAGANRLFRGGQLNAERYSKLLKMRDLFMTIYNADCPKICIENPTPMKIANLPPPSCVIQPYEFGEPYSKRTCLWLKNLPPLIPTSLIIDHMPYVAASSKNGKSYGVAYTAKERSKTFKNIALAMAQQWGG